MRKYQRKSNWCALKNFSRRDSSVPFFWILKKGDIKNYSKQSKKSGEKREVGKYPRMKKNEEKYIANGKTMAWESAS